MRAWAGAGHGTQCWHCIGWGLPWWSSGEDSVGPGFDLCLGELRSCMQHSAAKRELLRMCRNEVGLGSYVRRLHYYGYFIFKIGV